MSVGFDYEASTNGSSAAEHARRAASFASPAAASELVRSRPEVLVGAAFAGGLLAAFLLRRFGR